MRQALHPPMRGRSGAVIDYRLDGGRDRAWGQQELDQFLSRRLGFVIPLLLHASPLAEKNATGVRRHWANTCLFGLPCRFGMGGDRGSAAPALLHGGRGRKERESGGVSSPRRPTGALATDSSAGTRAGAGTARASGR